ncbi:MAG: protein-L-isoaspartate(D-aspartate) O-methyltransferase [Nanoarchaeota archaeon]
MDKKFLIDDLRKQGFSEKILNAFKNIMRENFISEKLKTSAYENIPLPIGNRQTISQPYTIAFMLSLLDLRDKQKILEVGSGSGYVLALMSKISKHSNFYGIEIIEELAEKSRNVLKDRKNVQIIHGDGSIGLLSEAPFDRIIISAAASEIPQELVNQLKIGGILVVPVKNSIIYLKKYKNKNEIKEFPGFLFVPFVRK